MTPTTTLTTDTDKGQLTDSRLGGDIAPLVSVPVLASDSPRNLRHAIKSMWRLGIIDNTSYCALGMHLDGVGNDSGFSSFDLNAFAVRWSVQWQEEKVRKNKKRSDTLELVDKEKQLTEAQIETALGKFEKKEHATVERKIQLSIDWGFE